jgi:hypothetical protein
MAGQGRSRYPGAQPFQDDELSRLLFHGREQEQAQLTHRILATRLTVVFARSGLGKTSLLNAGVAQKLRDEGLAPLLLRVGARELDPLESLYRCIESDCKRQGFDYLPGSRATLWHFFKTSEFWHRDVLLCPVLILDQFEELFTLQSEVNRATFLDQLSCLVRGVRPAEGDAPRPDLSDAAPPVKIIVSLREDFLANLEELSDRMPEILDQRFRLLPMARTAAARAIATPATLDHPGLSTKPFTVDPEAEAAILDFLSPPFASPTGKAATAVEPFQLQLICQEVEQIARRKQLNDHEHATVKLTDLGGESKLRRILRDFYRTQIDAIPSVLQRRRARKLCSEFLISPLGRRLRMEESEICRQLSLQPASLRLLLEGRLLRVDHTVDGDYYELSHDSLIGPVLDTRRAWFAGRAVVVLAIALVFFLGFAMVVWMILRTTFSSIVAREPVAALVWASILGVVLTFLMRTALRHLREFRDLWRRLRSRLRIRKTTRQAAHL